MIGLPQARTVPSVGPGSAGVVGAVGFVFEGGGPFCLSLAGDFWMGEWICFTVLGPHKAAMGGPGVLPGGGGWSCLPVLGSHKPAVGVFSGPRVALLGGVWVTSKVLAFAP